MDKKLKGSTLIEVLVAMVIISIIVVMSSTIFLNVQQSKQRNVNVVNSSVLKAVVDSVINQNDFTNKEIQTSQGKIIINFIKRSDSDQAIQVNASLYAPDKKQVCTFQKIILTEEK